MDTEAAAALDFLDDALQSAEPSQSDRQFQYTLSMRSKRRHRRRLEVVPEAADDPQAAPVVDASAPLPSNDAGAPAAAAGSASAASDSDELVLQQMDQLPGMMAHMGSRRRERENLRHQFRKISDRMPLTQRLLQSVKKLFSTASEAGAQVADWLTLGLYRSSFVAIEGRFGSGCASYFSFIRWLFVLNFCLSVLVFASFVLPQLLIRPQLKFEDTLPQALPQALQPDLPQDQLLQAVLLANRCSQLTSERIANLSTGLSFGETVTSLITGGGWMLQLPIFLGSYFNKSLMSYDADTRQLSHELVFDTSVAALLSLVSALGGGMLAALSTANSLYRNILRVSLRTERGARLSAELFSTWDFGLRAPRAARQKQRSVAMRLRSVVLHLQLLERARSARTLAVRCCAHAGTLLLFCAAAYLIYFATESQAMLADSRGLAPALRLLVDLLPQLTIAGINVVVPVLLGKLIRFEYYSASTEVVVQLARVVLLKLLSLVTLMFTIGSVVACAGGDACGNCRGVESLCWETYVGQQLYRTLAVDVLQCLLLAPLLDCLRWLAAARLARRFACCRRVPQSELLISNDVLSLVYTQSLCFAGFLFCPALLPVAALTFGCLFHIKRFTLPLLTISGKSFRSSRLERFFLDVLLLFLLLVLVPLTVCVLHIQPSRGCGPYRVHQSEKFCIGLALSNWVKHSGVGILQLLYNYTVVNSTAHVLLLLLLAIISYFFYSVIKARDTLIHFLERKLQNESKIKLELANRELQLMRVIN